MLLIVVGIVGSVIHVRHRRARGGIRLNHQPSTIASIAALSARSGLSELLDPTDDVDTIRRKLESLLFSLDADTGAVITCPREGDVEDAVVQLPQVGMREDDDGLGESYRERPALVPTARRDFYDGVLAWKNHTL